MHYGRIINVINLLKSYDPLITKSHSGFLQYTLQIINNMQLLWELKNGNTYFWHENTHLFKLLLLILIILHNLKHSKRAMASFAQNWYCVILTELCI